MRCLAAPNGATLYLPDGEERGPGILLLHGSEGGLSGWNSHDTICGAFIAGTVNPKEEEAWDPSKRAWRWRGSSDELLSTTPIEIERYSGPLFLSHGEEDKMVTVKSTAALRQDCAKPAAIRKCVIIPARATRREQLFLLNRSLGTRRRKTR